LRFILALKGVTETTPEPGPPPRATINTLKAGSGGSGNDPAGWLTRTKSIGEGKIDCVGVQRVDRLSRSLLDFAKLMVTFGEHQVSFVSVAQQMNNATSMGRLVLNVLLSFARSSGR